MKQSLLIISVVLALTSCNNDDVNVFDKTAAERSSEAIQNLKNELTAPANGWLVKYNPESDAGSYYVILNFNDDNTLRIRSDFGEQDGRFFDDTITYRIDNSLNLELIFETYSLFSFLYEQDDATFQAEFEFLYANKTGDDLVFTSKSDVSSPTVLVFTPASSNDPTTLLGPDAASKISALADDFIKYTTAYKVSYQNRDVALFLSMNNIKRTVAITAISKRTDTSDTTLLDFSTGFYIEGDSLVFENTFSTTFKGADVSIRSIFMGSVFDTYINGCNDPVPINGFNGTTSQNDQITFETTLQDIKGGRFAKEATLYFCPPENMLYNKEFKYKEVYADVEGAIYFQLYLNYENNLNAIGFVLQKSDGSYYFVLREFTPELVDNNLIFHWQGDLQVFNTDAPEADLNKIQKYIDLITAGDQTYAFKLNDGVYEFYNPCTKWSYIFINPN